MKIFMKKQSNIQKIIAAILIVIIMTFSFPNVSHASDWGGKLMKPLIELGAGLFDIAEGLLNHFMLGTTNLIDSVMLDKDDPNVDEGSLKVTNADKRRAVTAPPVDSEKLVGFMFSSYKLPNMLYSPEAIFSNEIAMLDINFIDPHSYNEVEEKTEEDVNNENVQNSLQDIYNQQNPTLANDGNELQVEEETVQEKDSEQKSIAQQLQGTIATWYSSFRNIAIVGLLSVLIYLGIRILIGSTAQDKAKYKERIKDWLVALCLVFVMHYIMAGTIMLTEKVTQLFSDSGATDVIIQLTGSNSEIGQNGATEFKTNLMGYMRFMVQTEKAGDSAAYAIIYMILVFYTVRFTFIYLRRVLYMAFFTIISPLVALTYPIDKLGDGKPQAFNMWFKEYMMNALIQPVHLILYTFLVGSSMDLAINNPIYAIVAIGFLIPAEKFIKKLFGIDKASTPGGLGDVVKGAFTLKGVQSLLGGGKKSVSAGKGGSNGDDSKIRMAGESGVKNLNAWRGENNQARADNEQREGNENNNIREQGNRSSGISNDDDYAEAMDTYSNAYNGFYPAEDQRNQSMSELAHDNADFGDVEEVNTGDFNDGLDGQTSQYVDYPPEQRFTSPTGKLQRLKDSYKTSRWGAALRTAGRIGQDAGSTVWRNKRKIAGAVGKVGGAVVGGMIGLAEGASRGDVSGALTGMSAGAVAGASIGGGLVNRTADIGNGASGALTGFGSETRRKFQEEYYGLDEAYERENAREIAKDKKEFMKNRQERLKYRDMTAKINEKTGKNYSVDDVMDKAFDYRLAKVDDEKDIQKGIIMESKYGDEINHDQMINVMQESKKYSQQDFMDEKKRNSLYNHLTSELGEQNGTRFMDMMAETKDATAIWEKEKEKMRNAGRNVPRTTRQTRTTQPRQPRQQAQSEQREEPLRFRFQQGNQQGNQQRNQQGNQQRNQQGNQPRNQPRNQ